MASIIREAVIHARPDDIWDAIRDFAAVHQRLVPGFVTDSQLHDETTRLVTFFNGAVAREVLVGVDDEARRLAYSVVDGTLGSTHHNSSAQVFAEGDHLSRLVWTTDVLPDRLGDPVGQMMDRGITVIKDTLESSSTGV